MDCLIKHDDWYITLQVFVLSLQGLQMVKSLLIGVFQFKELSAQRPGFFLRALQLTLRLLILLLPFRQDLGIEKQVVQF